MALIRENLVKLFHPRPRYVIRKDEPGSRGSGPRLSHGQQQRGRGGGGLSCSNLHWFNNQFQTTWRYVAAATPIV